MKLLLSPIRTDQTLTVEVLGNVLILNGQSLDFTPLPIGASLPRGAIPNDWIAGDVMRDMDGTLIVPILLPHAASAPVETLFPDPIDTDADGIIPLPPHATPEPTDED